MTKTKAAPAARLSLAGASEAWHIVVGLPGHFHPSIPVPLDQPGLATSEQLHAYLDAHRERVAAGATAWEEFRAEQIAKGIGDIGEFTPAAAPVELVDLDASLVDEHAVMAREQRAASARAAAKARRNGQASEPNVSAELDAAGNPDSSE